VSRKRTPKQAEVVAEGSGELDVQAITDALEADGIESVAGVGDADASADVDGTGPPFGEAAARAQDPDVDGEATVAVATATDAGADAAAADGDVGLAGAPEAAADADADAEAVQLPTSATSMDDAQLERLVEAMIFASDKPVTLQRLRQLTRVSDVRRIEAALGALTEAYRDRGIALQQVSGGYQMRTSSEFSPWVQQLIAGRPVRLSRAQLETLAIVAYRQPITRPEIDEIRGVDSSNTLRVLIDRSLIRILGKKEEVGRPLLYGTTKDFLDFFSLGDLRELPTLREYSELTAESRKVISDRLGLDPDPAAGASAALEADAALHDVTHDVEVTPDIEAEPDAGPAGIEAPHDDVARAPELVVAASHAELDGPPEPTVD
jgi:segregation and condensation protein B